LFRRQKPVRQLSKRIGSRNFPEFPASAFNGSFNWERPEEVTDIASSVKGEVVASNFDEPPEDQTRVAEIYS